MMISADTTNATELNTNNPIMNKLRQTLIEITEGLNPDYEDWISRINIG